MEMDLILLIVYPLLFAAEICLLYFAVKKPERKLWTKLFGLEILSVLAAVGLMFLFDRLPGNGMMPGLTWIGEFFYSLFAAVGYGVLFLMSLFLRALKKR